MYRCQQEPTSLASVPNRSPAGSSLSLSLSLEPMAAAHSQTTPTRTTTTPPPLPPPPPPPASTHSQPGAPQPRITANAAPFDPTPAASDRLDDKAHIIPMNQLCHDLAHRALDLLHQAQLRRDSDDPLPARVIIAISGIPGSGKSTLANKVAAILNNGPIPSPEPSESCVVANSHSHSLATVVPMDGFHLTRAQLDQSSDPVMAHRRRGAAFTFDAAGVVNMVKILHESTRSGHNNDPQSEKKNIIPTTIAGPSSTSTSTTTTTTTTTTTVTPYTSTRSRSTLFFPSFDHALKDPVADGIKVSPNTSIILLEGLYLLLDQSPWNAIANLVDDKWFIEVDPTVARTRVAKRHLQCGIVDSLDAGYRRYDDNDLLNAAQVINHRVDSDLSITSINDDGFVCQTC